MAQPKMNGSQLEHGEEVCSVLFVARGEASEVFDAVEEPLDAVARGRAPGRSRVSSGDAPSAGCWARRRRPIPIPSLPRQTEGTKR